MKKLFKNSVAVWLSLCILLASAGVPVFAHTCTMSSSCEKEFSVLPVKSCCSQATHKELQDADCIKKSSCCNDELTFYNTNLPAIKFSASGISIVPAMFITVAFSYNLVNAEHLGNRFQIPENAPPLPAGRALLAKIQILRT